MCRKGQMDLEIGHTMEFKRLTNRVYQGPVDWDWDKVREDVLKL